MYVPNYLLPEHEDLVWNIVANYLDTIWYQPSFEEIVELAQDALERDYGRRWPEERIRWGVRDAILGYERRLHPGLWGAITDAFRRGEITADQRRAAFADLRDRVLAQYGTTWNEASR